MAKNQPETPKKSNYIPRSQRPYQTPAPPNPQKQAARTKGLQQFQAKTFPRPLPSPQDSWDYVLDILCDRFDVRRQRQPNDDCGWRYDTNRKQHISPPRKDN